MGRLTPAIAAVFLIGLGEELWRKFLPKFLEALGANAGSIGLFRATEDFLDAAYQYPGGWLADRLGRRRVLLAFIALASVGYVVYLRASSWPTLFGGLALVMAWKSMASPALFALIGDALPPERRARGFVLQAVVKRIPMILAPLAGGLLIGRLGIAGGVRAGLLITLVLAAIALAALQSLNGTRLDVRPMSLRGVWRLLPRATKRLLISDILVRWCEGLADVFIILWVTGHAGVSVAAFGALAAWQATVSLMSYAPAAVARRPLVTETFVCFALYPASIVLSHGWLGLVLAFGLGGLREIGEPSRKALIIEDVPPEVRARAVGLYYLLRSVVVAPAAVAGGLLWQWNPAAPFWIAAVFGASGAVLFGVNSHLRSKHPNR